MMTKDQAEYRGISLRYDPGIYHKPETDEHDCGKFFSYYGSGQGKDHCFLQIADENSTFYSMVSLFLKQVYEASIGEAQKEKDHRLPIPMDFVLDEFCNIPGNSVFANRIASARSRNIRYHMVVQSLHRLKQRYGQDG